MSNNIDRGSHEFHTRLKCIVKKVWNNLKGILLKQQKHHLGISIYRLFINIIIISIYLTPYWRWTVLTFSQHHLLKTPLP